MSSTSPASEGSACFHCRGCDLQLFRLRGMGIVICLGCSTAGCQRFYNYPSDQLYTDTEAKLGDNCEPTGHAQAGAGGQPLGGTEDASREITPNPSGCNAAAPWQIGAKIVPHQLPITWPMSEML